LSAIANDPSLLRLCPGLARHLGAVKCPYLRMLLEAGKRKPGLNARRASPHPHTSRGLKAA
jgi:hypothetical protein